MRHTWHRLFAVFLLLCSLLPSQALAEPRFEIHFLDVGQGDAAIVICDDEVMMIDGGNPGDSDFIYSYLKNTIQVDHIDYMIASHPHEDHIGGLSGALNACSVGKVYSPVLEYDSRAFSSLAKYTEKQGLKLTLPIVGETFTLGSAVIQILRIVYGETSFLFTGDAECDAEHDLVDSEYDLSATLLKVAHHGSETSSSYVFLREVMPKYAVISVSAENGYDHPSETVLGRLRDIDSFIYQTNINGSIIFHSTGKKIVVP